MTQFSVRHPADKSHIRLSYIVNFYLNQEDTSAMERLLRRYEQYPASLLDCIQFVAVDDGSPLDYEIPSFDLNLTWLKITEDIPWNQAGARNLGAVYARSDKILLTDLDFVFPQETLGEMVRMRECGRDFYKVYKTNPDTGNIEKGHANTFLMSRARFMRFFGYDEEFAGHYGAEDFRFVKLHKAHGSRQRYLSRKYTCSRRTDLDRSRGYHSLARDLSFNTPIDARKKMEMETYGPDAGYSRIFLNFHWSLLKEFHREAPKERPERRLWKQLWYWRWLVGFR